MGVAKVLVPLLVIVRCGVTAAAGWQLANVCNDTGKSSGGAAGVYIIRRDNVDTQLGVSGHSADRSWHGLTLHNIASRQNVLIFECLSKCLVHVLCVAFVLWSIIIDPHRRFRGIESRVLKICDFKKKYFPPFSSIILQGLVCWFQKGIICWGRTLLSGSNKGKIATS